MWMAALMMVGYGMQAYGQYEAGRQNNQIAKYNASVNERQARFAIARGEESVRDYRSKIRRVIGSQRSGYAGQNVRLDSETVSQLDHDTRRIELEDMRRLRANAQLEAWGFRTQAKGQRMAGSAARDAGIYQAGGTLLTGAGDSYGAYSGSRRSTNGTKST